MKPVYSSLSHATGPHIAGICTIHIAPVEWLAQAWVPAFKTHLVPDVFMLPGRELIALELLQESYSYNEKPKTARGITTWELDLSGLSNVLTQETMRILNTYRYHQWVAIFKDRKGLTRIAGNTSGGLFFNFETSQVTSGGGEERIAVSMAMEAEYPAFFFGKEVSEIVVNPKLNVPGNGLFAVSVNPAEDGLRVFWGTASNGYPPGFSYILEKSINADFSSVVETLTVTAGNITAGFYNDTDIDENVTYYYRMKASISGYTDSDWAIDSGMLPAEASLPLDHLWADLDPTVGVDITSGGGFDLVNSWTDAVNGRMFNWQSTKCTRDMDGTLGVQVITSANASGGRLVSAQNFADPGGGLTIYLVGSQSATNDGNGHFFRCTSNLLLVRPGIGNGIVGRCKSNNNVSANGSIVSNDTYYTFRLQYTGSTVRLYVNEELVQELPAGDYTWFDFPLTLFSGFSFQSNKKIARMLVYTTSHDGATAAQVEEILKTTYGHY